MNNSKKLVFKTLLYLIGLSAIFTFFLNSLPVGLIIGIFLTIAIVYDPKRMEKSKKKAELKEKKKLENLTTNDEVVEPDSIKAMEKELEGK